MNILLIIICTLIPTNALAYLDPATGSIILQAVIAGAVTGLYFLRLYWQKLKTFVNRLLGKEIPEQESNNDSDDE